MTSVNYARVGYAPEVLPSQRKAKSRKDRPCDNCRRLKQRCFIVERDKPCYYCAGRSKPCTFVGAPSKRRRDKPDEREFDRDGEEVGGGDSDMEAMDVQQPSMSAADTEESSSGPSMSHYFRSIEAECLEKEEDSDLSEAEDIFFPSLDLETDDREESHYLGSGAFGQVNLAVVSANMEGEEALPGVNFRQVSQDPRNPAIFVRNPSLLYGRLYESGGKEPYDEMCGMLNEEAPGWPENLLTIFFEKTLPALPLTNHVRLEAACQGWHGAGAVPYALLAGILAHSTVYVPSLRHLFRPLWAKVLKILEDEYRQPRLQTLQLALLNLTARPNDNHGGNAIELTRAIGAAQLLGLHIDSTTWQLPHWERSVRKRIWWTLVINDKWSAALYGRPSNLHSSNASVPLPSLKDDDWGGRSEANDSMFSFVHFCQLTEILDNVLVEFYTVSRQSESLAPEDPLRRQRLKSLRILVGDLDIFYDSLPRQLKFEASGPHAPGVRSLQLSYLGLSIILCRLTFVYSSPTPSLPVTRASIATATQVVQFLEMLVQDDYDSFWINFAPNHISNCVTLLLHIAMCTAVEDNQAEAAECKRIYETALTLLERLLSSLCSAQVTGHWEVAGGALARARIILQLMEKQNPTFAPLRAMYFPVDDLSRDGENPTAFTNSPPPVLDPTSSFNIDPSMWIISDWLGTGLNATDFNL